MSRLRAAAAAGDPYRFALVDTGLAGFDGLPVEDAVAADATLSDTQLLMLSPTLTVDPGATGGQGQAGLLCRPILGSELLDRMSSLVAASSLPAPTPPESTPHAPMRGRVLVVEDDEINQMVAQRIVEKLGYEVHVVGNGEEALRAVAADGYAAVLMDCQMPIMDGYTATAEIRASESGDDRLPIIAMTASVTLEERQRCQAAGMDDYLSKPVDFDALRETLTLRAR